jgi:hypothetical protein
MQAIVNNCSESKVLAALCTQVNHKNPNIRAKTAVWVDRLVAALGTKVSPVPLALSSLVHLPNSLCIRSTL